MSGGNEDRSVAKAKKIARGRGNRNGTRARGSKKEARQLDAALKFIRGWSYEAIAAERMTAKSMATISRDVRAGLAEIKTRQKHEVDIQRSAALARYQSWLLEEPGDTVASRQNRIRIQARIDRLFGLTDGFSERKAQVLDLGEFVREGLVQANEA